MYAFFCYYVSIYKLAFTFKEIKILKKYIYKFTIFEIY